MFRPNPGTGYEDFVLFLWRDNGSKKTRGEPIRAVEGTGGEIEKQMAAFKEAHCKTCSRGQGEEDCPMLIRTYTEEKCWGYWAEKEEEATTEVK